MASVTVTYRNGRVAQLENIYIRGSKIRFLILPGKSSIHSCWCQFLCFPSSDMLRNAPMFKNMMTRRRGGAARGKSGILWAQAGAGGRGRGWGRDMLLDRGGGKGEFGEKQCTEVPRRKTGSSIFVENAHIFVIFYLFSACSERY